MFRRVRFVLVCAVCAVAALPSFDGFAVATECVEVAQFKHCI